MSGPLSVLSGQLRHVDTGQFSFRGLAGFYGKGSTNRCGCRFFAWFCFLLFPPFSIPCRTVQALALFLGVPLVRSGSIEISTVAGEKVGDQQVYADRHL